MHSNTFPNTPTTFQHNQNPHLKLLNDSSDLEDNYYTTNAKKQNAIIIESADLGYDYQLKLLSSNNTFPILKEIDPFILAKIQTHKTIAIHFETIIFYWILSYSFLLICNLLFYIQLGFVLYYHHLNKELTHNGVFYLINSFAYNSILFIDTLLAMFNFGKGQYIYNCLSEFNVQLEIAFVLLLIQLWMGDLLMSETYITFLKEKTFTDSFVNCFVGLLLVILVMNFKMKNFFEEYTRYVPVKYELIPNEGIVHKNEAVEVI